MTSNETKWIPEKETGDGDHYWNTGYEVLVPVSFYPDRYVPSLDKRSVQILDRRELKSNK